MEDKQRNEILDLIKQSPKITREELAKKLQIEVDDIDGDGIIDWRLSKLEQNGDLKRIDSDNGGYWQIKDKSKKL